MLWRWYMVHVRNGVVTCNKHSGVVSCNKQRTCLKVCMELASYLFLQELIKDCKNKQKPSFESSFESSSPRPALWHTLWFRVATRDSTCYHWNTRQHVLSLEHKTARVIIATQDSTCDDCHRRQHVLSSNHRSRYQIIDHVIKSLVRKTARVITRPQSRPLARCWRVVLHAPRARRCACVPSMKKGIECAYWCLSSYAHNCPCAHVRMADGRTVVLCSNRRTVVLCSNGRTIGAPATQQATQAKCAVASLRHQQRGQELYVRHPSGPNPRGQPQQERDRG